MLTRVNGRILTLVNGRILTLVNGRMLTRVNGRILTLVNGRILTLANGRSPNMPDPVRTPRRTLLLVFLASLALYTLTAGGSLTSTDAVVTYALAKSLVERHSIAVDEADVGNSAARGADGRYYSHFGLGQSLYDVPFYAAGRLARSLLPRPVGRPDTIPKAAVALGSAVAAAITVVLVWGLSFELTRAPRAALLAAAAAAIATPLWPYSKFGFSTALTTALLLGTSWLAWRAATTGRLVAAAGGGLVFAFGWLTRHEMALLLVPLTIVFALEGRERGRSRWTAAAVFVAVSCSGGLAWAAYNAIRFGSPLKVGYTPTFGLHGYLAYLASPAGSVVLYCPIAVAALAGVYVLGRRRPSLVALVAGPLATGFLFYGALVDWPGGRSYGPRYLVPGLVMLTPGLAALVAERRMRVGVAAALVAVCAVLQAPGVLVDYSKVSVDWAHTVTPEALAARNWRIDASPLVLGARASTRAIPDNAAWLSGRRPLPPAPASPSATDRTFAQQLSFSLDFWWAYLVYLRVLPRTVALSVASVLLVLAAVSAALAWRSTSSRVGHPTRDDA
jgi:4-amino-4-deoxy-L-arabinose transferase-like glycosyltransferase